MRRTSGKLARARLTEAFAVDDFELIRHIYAVAAMPAPTPMSRVAQFVAEAFL